MDGETLKENVLLSHDAKVILRHVEQIANSQAVLRLFPGREVVQAAWYAVMKIKPTSPSLRLVVDAFVERGALKEDEVPSLRAWELYGPQGHGKHSRSVVLKHMKNSVKRVKK